MLTSPSGADKLDRVGGGARGITRWIKGDYCGEQFNLIVGAELMVSEWVVIMLGNR